MICSGTGPAPNVPVSNLVLTSPKGPRGECAGRCASGNSGCAINASNYPLMSKLTRKECFSMNGLLVRSS